MAKGRTPDWVVVFGAESLGGSSAPQAGQAFGAGIWVAAQVVSFLTEAKNSLTGSFYLAKIYQRGEFPLVRKF